MSVIRTAEIPKIGKIKAKIVRSFVKKLRNPYFFKILKSKNYCDVIYKMCRVANIIFRINSYRS